MENIDFMKWGEYCVRGQEASFKRMAQEIEEKYGIDARMEFEVGVYNSIASYSFVNYPKLEELSINRHGEDIYIEQQIPKYYTENDINRNR